MMMLLVIPLIVLCAALLFVVGDAMFGKTYN